MLTALLLSYYLLLTSYSIKLCQVSVHALIIWATLVAHQKEKKERPRVVIWANQEEQLILTRGSEVH